MRNEESYVLADAVPAASESSGGSRDAPSHQSLQGVAGQLRPYRDVRAGFDLWRRLALAAWSAREEAGAIH